MTPAVFGIPGRTPCVPPKHAETKEPRRRGRLHKSSHEAAPDSPARASRRVRASRQALGARGCGGADDGRARPNFRSFLSNFHYLLRPFVFVEYSRFSE